MAIVKSELIAAMKSFTREEMAEIAIAQSATNTLTPQEIADKLAAEKAADIVSLRANLGTIIGSVIPSNVTTTQIKNYMNNWCDDHKAAIEANTGKSLAKFKTSTISQVQAMAGGETVHNWLKKSYQILSLAQKYKV